MEEMEWRVPRSVINSFVWSLSPCRIGFEDFIQRQGQYIEALEQLEYEGVDLDLLDLDSQMADNLWWLRSKLMGVWGNTHENLLAAFNDDFRLAAYGCEPLSLVRRLELYAERHAGLTGACFGWSDKERLALRTPYNYFSEVRLWDAEMLLRWGHEIPPDAILVTAEGRVELSELLGMTLSDTSKSSFYVRPREESK